MPAGAACPASPAMRSLDRPVGRPLHLLLPRARAGGHGRLDPSRRSRTRCCWPHSPSALALSALRGARVPPLGRSAAETVLRREPPWRRCACSKLRRAAEHGLMHLHLTQRWPRTSPRGSCACLRALTSGTALTTSSFSTAARRCWMQRPSAAAAPRAFSMSAVPKQRAPCSLALAPALPPPRCLLAAGCHASAALAAAAACRLGCAWRRALLRHLVRRGACRSGRRRCARRTRRVRSASRAWRALAEVAAWR
jgi:hypothetical protein